MVYKKFSTMTVVYCLKMVVAISWVQIIFEQKKKNNQTCLLRLNV